MVLSPDYMKSQFASPEWAAAFAADPQGIRRSLLPVIVRECNPDGLLAQIVHINLAGKDQNSARSELLGGIRPERAKPSRRPSFPGNQGIQQKLFPGKSETESDNSRKVYVPKIRQEPTDVEKRRFLRGAFNVIRTYFDAALLEFSGSHQGLDFDFQQVTAMEFTAEIFLHGKSAAACRIWQGGIVSDNSISYAEGRHNFGSNSCNEILSVTTDNSDVALSSMMGGFWFDRASNNVDLKHMSGEEAAEYLWRRFVSNMEYRR